MKRDVDERASGEHKERPRATAIKPYDRVKKIVGLIEGLAPRHRRFTVFQDMVTMMGCAISNSVDQHHFAQREKMYMECVRRYEPEEVGTFPEMLAELALRLEEAGPDDVLGRLYMQLDLGNAHKGQFFTPMHVCDLMAEISYSGGLRQKVESQGFVTVNDPASGGGAMLIAFAKNLADEGLSYQRHMHATAVDVDFTAAMMSYVQLSLLGIPAVVVHGNTLTVEEFSSWTTPAHVLGNWSLKLNMRRQSALTEADNTESNAAGECPGTCA